MAAAASGLRGVSSTKSAGTVSSSSQAARQEAVTRLWTMAVLYGMFAVVFLFLLIAVRSLESFQVVFLVLVTGLLFTGLGASLYTIYRTGKDEEPAVVTGIYSCKHCGKRFDKQRIRDTHERSCSEMKL